MKKPDHIHIPFKYGHITWNGKKKPTKEQIAVFEKLAEFVFTHENLITSVKINGEEKDPSLFEAKSQGKPLNTLNIPAKCLYCGLMNSENCNTCEEINIFPDAFIEKARNQYLADQQDGFVSNIDSYLQSTYPELTKHGLDNLKKLILKDK